MQRVPSQKLKEGYNPDTRQYDTTRGARVPAGLDSLPYQMYTLTQTLVAFLMQFMPPRLPGRPPYAHQTEDAAHTALLNLPLQKGHNQVPLGLGCGR